MLHAKRLRWTDWIGLTGLALLLVWTPGYVAQDPTERALTGGETFTLPMPRDGDRAVLDLVVTYGDGRIESFPAVAEIRIDGARDIIAPGLPEDVAFSHSVHQRPAAFDLGFARYESNETVHSTWYDGQGGVMWIQNIGTGQYGNELPGDPFPPPENGRIPEGCERIGPLNTFPGADLRYEPNAWNLQIAELGQAAVRMLGGQTHLDCLHTARPGGGYVNEAAHVGPHLLLGWNAATTYPETGDPSGPVDAIDICQLDKLIQDGIHGSPIYPPSDLPGGTVLERLRDPEPLDVICQSESWWWFSPNFPLPVGFHKGYQGPNGDLLFELDLIPREIEKGNGHELPVTVRPAEGWSLANPVMHDGDPEMMTLGDLSHDTTPLIHSHTAAFIDQQVRDNAPDSLRAFLAKAHIVSISGETAPEPYGTDEDERRSYWRLEYADPGGHLRPVSMQLEWLVVPATSQLPGPIISTPTGPYSGFTNATRTWTATVTDRCADPDLPEDSRAFYCVSTDPAFVSPDLRLVSLASLMKRAADLANPQYGSPTEPAMGVHGSIQYSLFGGFSIDKENGTKTPTGEGVFFWHMSHVPSEPGVGFIQAAQYELGNGTLVSYTKEHRGTTEAGPRQPRPITASNDAVAPVSLTPLGRTLAFSGILLVAFAALTRLGAALKSGALPAFAAGLYAKIRNEDVLLHERRDTIVDMLRAEPGLTAKELAERLGAGWGATVHHLETLRRSGLVTRVAMGRNRHHFLARETAPDERRLLALRREPAYAAFLDAVVANPGRNLEELAEALPQGLSGLSRTGTRLEREGLIAKRRDRFSVRFYPAAAATPERRK